jgi:UDP-N-acetylglucosamine--N-acetylmuramyl-(pentapeptide) pyrophosphoryl-undecaprenol N-acetylglucosamine transferase
VGLAALRGIPTLLMEQNATPGLTNRLLSRLVRAAAVTYDESLATFGRKAFVAGNPVRPEFFAPAAGAPAPSGRARVLVFGGSQGAHAINVAMAAAAATLGASAPGVEVTHQTGERDVSMVREAYAAGVAARVEPFLYEMDREMRAADVIVCRAGATTLAELTAAGRAAILIPLPTATDDHQRRNAEALVRHGAALAIDQRELTGPRLAEELLALARDGGARQRMGAAARGMARPDAARVIVDKLLAMAAGAR